MGCSKNVQKKEEEPKSVATVTRDLTTGTWVTAACWHNCGGRCLNKALVKDGIVVRQKTDDTHEDTPDYPQQRACVRGRSQRNHVLSADRLKDPMKRKSWQPGGGENSHGELRGVDEWERISWDEAYDYIADEIKRIVDEHGNRALFALSLIHISLFEDNAEHGLGMLLGHEAVRDKLVADTEKLIAAAGAGEAVKAAAQAWIDSMGDADASKDASAA